MSGFNPETGIFQLTDTKALRYLAPGSLPAKTTCQDHCERLFRDAGFQVLRKTAFGLELVADDADVFEVLSGKAATWGRSVPSAGERHARWLATREWLNATALGKEMKPPVGAAKINKLLEARGLQVKRDGLWVPTELADGLFQMRPGSSAYGTAGREIPLWHRSVVDRLNPP